MVRGRPDRSSGSYDRDLQIHTYIDSDGFPHDLVQSRPLILPVSRFISAKVITSDKVHLEPSRAT